MNRQIEEIAQATGIPTIPHVPLEAGLRGMAMDNDWLDTSTMDCKDATLHPGDRIYLPAGTFHSAVTGVGGSVHLTVEVTYTGFTWGDLLVHTLLEFDPKETQGAVHCAVRHDPGYDPGMCMQGRPFKSRNYPPLLMHGSARLAEPVPMFKDPNPNLMDDDIKTLSVFDAVLYRYYHVLFEEVLVPQIAWSIKDKLPSKGPKAKLDHEHVESDGAAGQGGPGPTVQDLAEAARLVRLWATLT